MNEQSVESVHQCNSCQIIGASIVCKEDNESSHRSTCEVTKSESKMISSVISDKLLWGYAYAIACTYISLYPNNDVTISVNTIRCVTVTRTSAGIYTDRVYWCGYNEQSVLERECQ